MGGLHRTIHPVSGFKWARLGEVAPDVTVQASPGELSLNGADGETPMALMFFDPDGETHVYVFTEQGRKNLLQQLTGGIVVP